MSNIPSMVMEVFKEIQTEVSWLHARWIIYRQLFAKSPKRIDLLNECASTFFYIVQDILLGDILMTLSKLTDPARTYKKDNLSLEQLQERIEKQNETEIQDTLSRILNELKQKCQPFRTWRNKLLAHLDLTTAMKSTMNPLPGVSRQMIEEALELTRRYLNTIRIHYGESEMGYEHFLFKASDADALIGLLKFGLSYQQLVQEGKMNFDEFGRSDWFDA